VKVTKFAQMKLGYFVGDFFPTAYRTSACEVALKKHRKGEAWPRHYQKTATEINLLLSGMMEVEISTEFKDYKRVTIEAGDIFTVDPNERLKPHFLQDCVLVVVKVPSIPNDKVVEELE